MVESENETVELVAYKPLLILLDYFVELVEVTVDYCLDYLVIAIGMFEDHLLGEYLSIGDLSKEKFHNDGQSLTGNLEP